MLWFFAVIWLADSKSPSLLILLWCCLLLFGSKIQLKLTHRECCQFFKTLYFTSFSYLFIIVPWCTQWERTCKYGNIFVLALLLVYSILRPPWWDTICSKGIDAMTIPDFVAAIPSAFTPSALSLRLWRAPTSRLWVHLTPWVQSWSTSATRVTRRQVHSLGKFRAWQLTLGSFCML